MFVHKRIGEEEKKRESLDRRRKGKEEKENDGNSTNVHPV